MNTETQEKTITSRAEEIYNVFTTSKRDDGQEYVHLKGFADKDYPQWMQDVIFAGHLDTFPNDEHYKAIQGIIGDIVDADLGDDTDAILEYLNENLEANCYTAALTAWLASNINHVYYLTQAAEEYDMKDGFALLTMAQKLWLDEIASAIVSALNSIDS